MSLAEKIQKDLTDAMRAKDELRLSVLRGIKSAITYKETEKIRALDEAESIQILQTLVKQRKESIEVYEKTGRADLAAGEKEELAILEAYLPQAMSDAELEETIRGIAKEKGFSSGKDVGLLMKELMARHRGRADGKRAQEIARKLFP